MDSVHKQILVLWYACVWEDFAYVQEVTGMLWLLDFALVQLKNLHHILDYAVILGLLQLT